MNAFDIPACFRAMRLRVRNLGRSGLAATAVAAVDAALWDIKAKLLDVPLAGLLGRVRAEVPVYGSGGFTSYDDATLRKQLSAWVEEDGCRWVKMKIGTEPGRDPDRVAGARDAIGEAGLFVDANGALTVKQALDIGGRLTDLGVTWFEEPVSSDDRSGLRLLRERMAPPIDVAAGEYVYNLDDARHLLSDGAVDVLQCDASRCGITGFLGVAGSGRGIPHRTLGPLRAGAAPSSCIRPSRASAISNGFHDHVRIEHMLFDGAPVPQDGNIEPDMSRARSRA